MRTISNLIASPDFVATIVPHLRIQAEIELAGQAFSVHTVIAHALGQHVEHSVINRALKLRPAVEHRFQRWCFVLLTPPISPTPPSTEAADSASELVFVDAKFVAELFKHVCELPLGPFVKRPSIEVTRFNKGRERRTSSGLRSLPLLS